MTSSNIFFARVFHEYWKIVFVTTMTRTIMSVMGALWCLNLDLYWTRPNFKVGFYAHFAMLFSTPISLRPWLESESDVILYELCIINRQCDPWKWQLILFHFFKIWKKNLSWMKDSYLLREKWKSMILLYLNLYDFWTNLLFFKFFWINFLIL